MLEADGRAVEDFATCEAFLEAYHPGREACLLIDAYLPGMSGHRIVAAPKPFEPSAASHHDHRQRRRADGGTSHEGGRFGFHREAVQPQRPAAPVSNARSSNPEIRASRSPGGRWRRITLRLSRRDNGRSWTWSSPATPARTSPPISASASGQSRTHRASIMKKTGAKSLPALARLALAADQHSFSADLPHQPRGE